MNVSKIRLKGLETVDLPIVVAQPSDSYILKDATGLGPTGADVFSADLTVQGAVYQGRRPLSRELVFKVGLNPNYKNLETAATLRDRLYGMLTPETENDDIPIEFLFKEILVAKTSGNVSKIEPVYFTKDPEVQITMECTWPYLVAPYPTLLVPKTFDTFSVQNVGNAPSGIEMKVVFTAPVTNWTITHGTKVMKFNYPFLANDTLYINTQPGSRAVTLTRNAQDTDLIFAVAPGSKWIMLHGGNNVFTLSDNHYTWRFVQYTPQYLGV